MEPRKRRSRVLNRSVFVVLLSAALFAVAFLVTGLAGLFLTESFDRAALIGGVCGFAGFATRVPFLASGMVDRVREFCERCAQQGGY